MKAHEDYTLCLISSQIKKGAPMRLVIIPKGNSAGAAAVLARISEVSIRVMPKSAEPGSTRR